MGTSNLSPPQDYPSDVRPASQVTPLFMILSRLLACLLGLVALALSLYVYEEYIHLLGFPDGHVTALGASEKKLAAVFIALSLLVGLYLLYVGTMADRSKVAARLVLVSGWYLLVLTGTAAADYYLRSRLDGGTGG